MRRICMCVLACCTLIAAVSPQQAEMTSGPRAYFGFDRNDYPGDANLAALHRSFAFVGYWLNVPPGAKNNSWPGKRDVIERAGFGFAVLFNGRTDAEIKASGDAQKLGSSDARLTVEAARREGFRPGTIIFLDQEEGGRLLPEQRAYLHAWADGVIAAGFGAGVYCSGIPANEAGGVTVVTADDIRKHAGDRKLAYWVVNDACPPSPGCSLRVPLRPRQSGVDSADIWQFAQSPRRKDFAAGCSNYSPDLNCYAPGLSDRLHIDLNVANSSDPSHGRSRR